MQTHLESNIGEYGKLSIHYLHFQLSNKSNSQYTYEQFIIFNLFLNRMQNINLRLGI